jgi:hypothetical protein
MQITREQSKRITELIRLSDGESAKLSQYGDETDVHVAVRHEPAPNSPDGKARINTKRVTLDENGKPTRSRLYRAKDGYWQNNVAMGDAKVLA